MSVAHKAVTVEPKYKLGQVVEYRSGSGGHTYFARVEGVKAITKWLSNGKSQTEYLYYLAGYDKDQDDITRVVSED